MTVAKYAGGCGGAKDPVAPHTYDIVLVDGAQPCFPQTQA
jgi:hypothetical protein